MLLPPKDGAGKALRATSRPPPRPNGDPAPAGGHVQRGHVLVPGTVPGMSRRIHDNVTTEGHRGFARRPRLQVPTTSAVSNRATSGARHRARNVPQDSRKRQERATSDAPTAKWNVCI